MPQQYCLAFTSTEALVVIAYKPLVFKLVVKSSVENMQMTLSNLHTKHTGVGRDSRELSIDDLWQQQPDSIEIDTHSTVHWLTTAMLEHTHTHTLLPLYINIRRKPVEISDYADLSCVSGEWECLSRITCK